METKEIIRSHEQAIGLITLRKQDISGAEDFAILGTGFLIDATGRFITCWHVVKDVLLENLGKLRIHLPTISNGVKTYAQYQVSLIRHDVINDIALMQCNAVAGQHFSYIQLPTNQSTLEAGKDVVWMGYPLAQDFMNMSFGVLLNSGVTTISSTSNFNSIERFLIAAHINKGASGSPVFSKEDGSLLGIAAGAITTSGNVEAPLSLGICRPIKFAINLTH